MTGTGLLIAAHGSNNEPGVNERIQRLAARLAEARVFDEVCCGFHQGEPGFAAAVDGLRCRHLVVVPLMTSNGYYARTVLPRALAEAKRAPEITFRQTQAVGGHPCIPGLVSDRVGALVTQFGLDASRTAAVIVGHGTPRHRQSRDTTLRCVEAVATDGCVDAALPTFLDDEPGIEAVASVLRHPTAILIPFLIGRGLHGAVDIAERFGMVVDQSAEPPVLQRSGDRRVMLDLPLGCWPEIFDVVLELAMEACHGVAGTRS